MKKLLCIVCLTVSVLSANVASASIRTPMSRYYTHTTTSVSISKSVVTKGGMHYKPTRRSFHGHRLGYRKGHHRYSFRSQRYGYNSMH
jgi:hypothetical protein